MTDWTKPTGSSATMMVRDTGSNVEFWINSNNGTTWSSHIPWSGTVNNTGVSGSYNYPAGAGWRRVGVWAVSYNQNVTFKLGSTGTGGFGGPTTLGPIFISRATVPPAPSAVRLSNIASTSMRAQFDGQGDGGSVIYVWQIGYGTDPNSPQTIIDTTTTATIQGLTPGTVYYFWSRGTNAQGNGYWSARSQATTLRVPDAPSAPIFSEIAQVSVRVAHNLNGDGGSTILYSQIGYGTNSAGPTISTNPTSQNNILITGLDPGATYYFWVRVENLVGWSPWSASSVVTLIAGAYINVGGVWKRAVPYVKVGATWKVARAWGRVAGTWRETL